VPAKFFRTTAKGRVYIPPTSQKGGNAVQKWPEQCLCAIFSPRIVRKVGAKNGEKREKLQEWRKSIHTDGKSKIFHTNCKLKKDIIRGKHPRNIFGKL